MLSSTTVRATVPGSDSVGPFSFPFKIFAATDLDVRRTSATGAVTPLAYPTDYTVAGVGNASGGTVTLAVALATGQTLSIVRATPLTQPTSLRVLGTFFPGTHEDALDRVTMQVQQLQDAIKRSARLAPSIDPANMTMELPAPATGQVLGWSSPTTLSTFTLDTNAVAIPGAGRTVTTLSAYLSNNSDFNVRDFGALGNNTADDTIAIQAALNAAKSAGGGTVRVPIGQYKTTDDLTVDASVPITIQGEGFNTAVGTSYGDNAQWLAANAIIGTVIKQTVANKNGIKVDGAVGRRLQVRNLALLGPGSGTGIGLYLGAGAQCHNMHSDHVYVANFSVGQRINNAIDHNHNKLHIVGCGSGIQLYAVLDDLRYFDPKVETCAVGWDVLGGALINVYGGLVQSNTVGVRLAPSVGNGIDGFHMDGTWFEANGVPWAIDSTNGVITDVSFSRCRDSTGGVIPVTVNQAIARIMFDRCKLGAQSLTFAPGVTGVTLINTAMATFDPGGAIGIVIINDGVSAVSVASTFDPSVVPGATYIPDWRAGADIWLTLTGDVTINLPTHTPGDSATITFHILQDGTGGHNVTFAAGYHVTWSNTGNTANKSTSISVRKKTSSSNWYECYGGQTPYVT